jgi:hypothetical protein
MKKTPRIFFSVLSIVTLVVTSGVTALAEDTAAPEVALAPGWASGETIQLAQAAAPADVAASPSTASEQPFSPRWYATQAIVLAQTTAAGQTAAPATNAPPPATEEGKDFRFHKSELDFSGFGAYTDQAGGKWGAGAAATYYITERIGLGAATYWTETRGTFFDNAEAEGYFRFPVFKIIAPYAVGSVGYQFDRKYWFETVGGGVDFRPFKRLSAFSDIQYRISNNHDKSPGGPFLRIGARFPL